MTRIVPNSWKLIRESVSNFFADDAFRMSAAVAFYTALSLAPMVILGLAAAAWLWGADAARDRIVGQIEHLIGTPGAEAIQAVIASSNKPRARGTAAIIGILTLVFSASAVFGELQSALNTVWHVKTEPGLHIWRLVRKRLITLGMLGAIGFLMLVSLLLTSMLSLLMESIRGGASGGGVVWQVLNFATSLVVFFLLFALIFKVLPDAEIAWRDTWIGAAVTTVLFALGKQVIGLYLGRASVGSAYGAAGSLVVLLVWVYYSTLIVLLGAEFTHAYVVLSGKKPIPESHAVKDEDAPDGPARGKRKRKPAKRDRFSPARPAS